MKRHPITEKDNNLTRAALDCLAKNGGGGANNRSAAAVLCKSGQTFSAVGFVEGQGFPALLIALGAAYSAGEREFETVVEVDERAKNNLRSPGGACRELIAALSPDMKVLLNDSRGNPAKHAAADLLPLSGKPEGGGK